MSSPKKSYRSMSNNIVLYLWIAWKIIAFSICQIEYVVRKLGVLFDAGLKLRFKNISAFCLQCLEKHVFENWNVVSSEVACLLILITSKHLNTSSFKINVNDKRIKRVLSYKYLGVIVDGKTTLWTAASFFIRIFWCNVQQSRALCE